MSCAYQIKKTWGKYLILFFVALIWFTPLSFFLEYNAYILWDPMTHFINQSNIAFFNCHSPVRSYWLSDYAGAMWLKLCFSKSYLYWWFHFGGCLLISLNAILWLYVFFSAFKLPASRLIPVGLVSILSLFFPFYLMIGYGTFPMFLLGIVIALLLQISPDKHYLLLKIIFLGVLCAILPETRYNLLPFAIVPLLCLLVYYNNDKKKLLMFSFCYICVFLLGHFFLKILTKNIFGEETILSNHCLTNIIFDYCQYWFVQRIKSIIIGIVFFVFLFLLKKYYQYFLNKKVLFIGILSTAFLFFFLCFIFRKEFNIAILTVNFYGLNVVLPLFICSLLLLLYLSFPIGERMHKKVSFNINSKKKLSLFIAIGMGFSFFTFGSEVLSLTTILWSIPFVSFFSAILSCFFIRKKYARIIRLILSSLFVFNILVTIEATIGFDISKYCWYQCNLGCCKGMFTSNKARFTEYNDVAQIIEKYISPGDCVFEYVPYFASKWLPLTVTLGGQLPFTFWKKMPVTASKKIEHILIWYKNSEMHKYDKQFYYIDDFQKFEKDIVHTESFSLIQKKENFSFYSKKHKMNL